MDDTIGDENIGSDDLGVADHDLAVLDSDRHLLAVDRLDLLSILEIGAVGHGSVHHVVGQDGRELLNRQGGGGGGELGKCRVGRGENGNILELLDRLDQVGLGQGLGERLEVELGQSRRSGGRKSQDGVDHVDHTAVESNVLEGSCVSQMPQKSDI